MKKQIVTTLFLLALYCIQTDAKSLIPVCPIEGQVFQRCRTCPATCEDPGFLCTLQCQPGCGCPSGQLIDEANNRCVKPKQCPAPEPECPIDGQVFQRCRTCPATCEDPGLLCTLQCQPGCGCPSGQLIDEANNRCVDPKQCPAPEPECPIDGQVFQRCRACPATCEDPGFLCTLQCQPGCGCPSGQLIDEANNRCVDPKQCTAPEPECPIEGQVFQECHTCPATCEDPDLLCTLQCQPGCGCPSGQLIDEANNRCVKPKQCPAPEPECPIDGQVFQRCRTCPATCEDPGFLCTLQCQPGCGCPSGQLIDEANNRCVKPKQCPAPEPECPIDGQVFQRCRTCPATCEDPGLLCTLQCQPGCGCPSGQLIDEANNRCVDPKQCPAPEPECPIDGQVFQRCRACPATCEDPGFLCTLQCQPGCGCPSGQLIDEANNRCVDPKQCTAPEPECPIEGQVFQECHTCPATCEDPDLLCTLQCQPGCGCPSGQLIDEANNRCVKPKQCPAPEPECPIDGQVFQRCRTCPATCEDPGLLCTLQCQPGCGCPSGQLIDEANNRCVDPKQCPAPEPECPIDGQVFQRCRTCPATCEDPGLLCTLQCQPGCGCPSGQLIDEANNRCVDPKQCPAPEPECPIDGQVFQRCRTCPATCEDPGLLCTLQCQPGCGCPSGQLIDEANNRCVDPKQCPAPEPECPIDGQVFQRCRTCPATCEDPGLLCTLQCQPGCGCPSGQLIDETNNRCVDPKQCPAPEPAIESLVCPIAGQVFQECRTCPATCEEPDLACPDVCREGCGCPFGKVIDEATNSCVDPKKCKISPI